MTSLLHHLMIVAIHRFGSPGNVQECYNVFADYYMKTFNCSTSKVALSFLTLSSFSPLSLSFSWCYQYFIKTITKTQTGCIFNSSCQTINIQLPQ